MAARAGSNVSLTLYFLRLALATNLALCLVWLACTVGCRVQGSRAPEGR